MHKNEISEMLKLMVQRGMLVSEGYGRGTRYVLPKKNQNLMEYYSATFSDANMATSDANVATSSLKKRLPKEQLSDDEIISWNDFAQIVRLF